jgi:hypothetical protein
LTNVEENLGEGQKNMADQPGSHMEEAAHGMSDEQVAKELERLNQMKDRTQGQEQAREILEHEFGNRLGPACTRRGGTK